MLCLVKVVFLLFVIVWNVEIVYWLLMMFSMIGVWYMCVNVSVVWKLVLVVVLLLIYVDVIFVLFLIVDVIV